MFFNVTQRQKRSFLKEPFIQTNIKPVTNTTLYNFVFLFFFRCLIEELTKRPACAVNMSCIAVGQVGTCPQQACDHYNNCCQLRMTHYLTHFDISCLQFKFVYLAPSHNSSHPKFVLQANNGTLVGRKPQQSDDSLWMNSMQQWEGKTTVRGRNFWQNQLWVGGDGKEREKKESVGRLDVWQWGVKRGDWRRNQWITQSPGVWAYSGVTKGRLRVTRYDTKLYQKF